MEGVIADRASNRQFAVIDGGLAIESVTPGAANRTKAQIARPSSPGDPNAALQLSRGSAGSGRLTGGDRQNKTRAGRYLRVVYIRDPEPESVLVITAYELRGKPLFAYRRTLT